MGRARPDGACGPRFGYLSIAAFADFQAKSDLRFEIKYQRDYSSHRVEPGLDVVRADVGRPSFCSNPCDNNDNSHQTDGYKEMRSRRTPEWDTDWE